MYLNKKNKNQKNKSKGQITIFFAVLIVLVMTVVAFIINIGIFVKAKINLQNAVDAAAWSGAAVQSRLLTNIAYLNWEMRNTYKEWLFKYYVLGQISNSSTNVDDSVSENSRMDFRLKNFRPNEPIFDKWNIPSICIKYQGEPGNMCNIYTTPGLPRTATQDAIGVDATFNQAINQITRVKSEGCVQRAKLNMHAAILWAYGVGDPTPNLFQGAPVIAGQRPGAWTEAIELAMRIRNLEWIVNRPPRSEGICRNSNNCLSVTELAQNESQGSIPANERSVKAFWAAYRNLGNTDERGPSELKESFKLTELTPRIQSQAQEQSLNYLLIPSYYDKYYLDLQLNILNFATFFSVFVPSTRLDSNGIPLQGECNLSKMALPVPGYPLGFSKNPNVLTYYAVKGEAKFNGLLSPFKTDIVLKAYAAAKPFGGRIGPQLFKLNDDKRGLTPRSRRSFSYITALINPIGTFRLGHPIPSDPTVWVTQEDHVIGGLPSTSDNSDPVRYSIPNIIYDVIPGKNNLEEQNATNGSIQLVSEIETPTTAQGTDTVSTYSAGLYNGKQFAMLKKPLDEARAATPNDNLIRKSQVDQAIINVRRPTKYETLNYLIPTLPRPGKETRDNTMDYENVHPVLGNFQADPFSPDDVRYYYRIFAPLFGENLLYRSIDDIELQILNHIDRNRLAVDKFSTALFNAAENIRQDDQANAQGLYRSSADIIHNSTNATTPTCPSLAGQFRYFFTGDSAALGSSESNGGGCGNSLKDIIVGSIGSKASNNPAFAFYFNPTWPKDLNGNDSTQFPENYLLKSGYAPGPEQGASLNQDGVIIHPFLAGVPPIDAHRNFYSTKFVSLESLFQGTSQSQIGSDMATYSEGSPILPSDLGNLSFQNPLEREDSQISELDPIGLGITH